MTVSKFNPEQFRHPVLTEQEDPDAEIFSSSVLVSIPKKRMREYYIPSFPMKFLKQIVPARDAIPVLLVALAMMRMKGEEEIALGSSLWLMVGNPGPRIRSRLLRQISGLPETLCQLEARVGRPHLLRTGPDWPQKNSYRS